ncbi:hypothetical protein FB451DRAFT_1196835 [Mycena latifolia]|nr:hypothetical protein FB451DRAFT_1196835 [Mycena latifolia]
MEPALKPRIFIQRTESTYLSTCLGVPARLRGARQLAPTVWKRTMHAESGEVVKLVDPAMDGASVEPRKFYNQRPYPSAWVYLHASVEQGSSLPPIPRAIVIAIKGEPAVCMRGRAEKFERVRSEQGSGRMARQQKRKEYRRRCGGYSLSAIDSERNSVYAIRATSDEGGAEQAVCEGENDESAVRDCGCSGTAATPSHQHYLQRRPECKCAPVTGTPRRGEPEEDAGMKVGQNGGRRRRTRGGGG